MLSSVLVFLHARLFYRLHAVNSSDILSLGPGPPSKLRFPTITPSVVVVTWAPPEMTGGNITRYRVSYRLRDDSSARTVVRPTLSSSKLTDSITSLSPDKFYIFEVQAYTAVGWGEEASAEIYTSRNQNTGLNICISCSKC